MFSAQKLCTIGAASLLFVAACIDSLPALPEDDESSPRSVEILDVQPAGGGAVQALDGLRVGLVYQLRARVTGAAGQTLAGEPLVVSVETESFEEVVRFPRGTGCVTPYNPPSPDEAGVCHIVFRFAGPVATVGMRIRAQRALEVTDLLSLTPQPDRDSVTVRIMAPGVGAREWSSGDADPLLSADSMPLSMEAQAPTPLIVVLEDRFGNPLVGERVRLQRWISPAEQGSGEPSGPADGGAGAATPDTGLSPSPEAGAGDGPGTDGRENSTQDSGPPGDVGSGITEAGTVEAGQELETPGDESLGQGYFQVHEHESGECSDRSGDESFQDVRSAVDGRALFCLKAGASSGAWKLVIVLPALAPRAQILGAEQDGFVLNGITRTGDPAFLEVWGHPGEAEPLSRCEAEGVTPTEYFRVLTRDGRPVYGAQVAIETEGSIQLISSARPSSDEDGLVPVRVSCPLTMPDRAAIKAELPGIGQQKTIYVRLEVQRIDRLRLLPDSPGQRLEELGKARAGEAMRFRVIAEDSRGNPAAESRLDLTVAISQASNQLMHLSEGTCVQDPAKDLDGTSIYTDADGVYRFELCGLGLSTLVQPMGLDVRAYGQTTRLLVPITLLPGPPARVLTNPPERVTTTVGGSAGALEVVVTDEVGNGVSGVSVSLAAPPAVLLTRQSGLSNVLGRFGSWILSVDEEGEHIIEINVSAGVPGEPGYFSSQTQITVAAGLGVAERLAFYRNGLPMIAVGGAVSLEMGVGTQLARPIVARLENRQGGGFADVGLAAELIEGNLQDCGRIGIDGRVTDAAGEIQFGGVDGVLLEAGTGLGDCLWRLSAGNDVFENLRVHQVAGDPHGGQPSLILAEGEVGELISLQSSPRDWGEGLPAIATVRVQAQDRFGNPVEGLRMWLDATNCWIEQRVQVLGPDGDLGLGHGEGFWRVAGGRDHQSPCVITMNYEGEWQQAVPLTIPIVGLPSPQIDWIDRPSYGGNTCDDRGSGCNEREQCLGRYCYERGPHYFMKDDPFGEQELVLRIDPALVIRPPELAAQVSGTCYEEPDDEHGDPYARCSHVEFMEAEAFEVQEGNQPVTRYRYELVTRLPIKWRTRGNRAEFFITLSNEYVGAGRVKGLRIRQPDGHTTGPIEQIYARPPVTWTRQATTVISPDFEHDVRLRSGFRLQLDGDEPLETVVCGDDPDGGLVAVVNPTYRDQAPPQVGSFRTWEVGESGNRTPRPSNSRLACALGDLNEDGHKDLIIATGISDQENMPRLVLLKGLPVTPFFDFENSVIITLNEAVAGAPAHQVAFESNPRRILFCQSYISGGRGDCYPSRINDQSHGGFGRVEIQADPFTGDPAHAIGLQENLGTYSIHHFQGHPNLNLPGIGWISSGGHLQAGSPNSGHSPLVHAADRRNIVFRSRDQRLISVDATATLYTWSQDGRLLGTAEAPFGSDRVGFSHDGEFGCTSESGRVHLFRTEDAQVIASMEAGPEQGANHCFFSQDGSTLVAVEWWEHRDHRNSCRSTHQGTHVFATEDGRLRFRTPVFQGDGCGNRSPRVVINADGSRLVVANMSIRQPEGDLTVWDQDGNLVDSLEIPGSGAWRLAAPADLSEILINTYNDGDRFRQHLRAYTYPGFAQTWHVPDPVGHEFKSWGFLTTADGRWHITGHGQIYDLGSRRWLVPRSSVNIGDYSVFGMTGAVQPYTYLSTFERNNPRSGDLVWLRSLDRTVPMAVLPPYDHGLVSQERRVHNHHRPGTWLLQQEESDGWLAQIKRSYDHSVRHNAFAGVDWGNQVFFSKPSTWRPNCGDGITQPDELMDRGQPFVGPQDCGAGAVDSCGDGELAPGEQCDDGDQDADDGCDHRCQLTQGSGADEAMESCADLAATQPSGSYWINPASDDPADAFEAYCFWQGEGPAWTLMMKLDGRNDTFLYDAELWTNAEPLRPEARHIDRFTEFKAQGFDRLEISELLVGTALNPENHLTALTFGRHMPYAPWPHLGRQRKWMAFQIEGDPDFFVNGELLPREPLTLQRLLTEQEPRGHTMTREGWLGFMERPRLQEHCNTMGFNLELGGHRLRLGIIANDQNDCNSPDTWVGLGGNHVDAWDYDRYGQNGSRDDHPNTTNAAGSRHQNWGHPRWGYLLAR